MGGVIFVGRRSRVSFFGSFFVGDFGSVACFFGV